MNHITRTVGAYHKDAQCNYSDSPPGPDHLEAKILHLPPG